MHKASKLTDEPGNFDLAINKVLNHGQYIHGLEVFKLEAKLQFMQVQNIA